MGQRKLIDRPVEKTISIPRSIHDKWAILLTDSLTGKVKHGAWARLVTRLLKNELERQIQANSMIQYHNRKTGEPTGPDPLDPEG